MLESLLAMRHSLLLLTGVGGLLLGVWPLLHVCRRLGRALIRRQQKPWGLTRYLTTVATGAFLTGVGTASLGLWLALSSFGDVGHKTEIAEIQCIELQPGKLRVYYVPLDAEGRRGATESYDVSGDQWSVGGDLVRFRPLLGHLGVNTVYQVTRVEGRWLKAEDANSHKATAFDRSPAYAAERSPASAAGGPAAHAAGGPAAHAAGGPAADGDEHAPTGSGWLALYQHGTRGPLGWLVQGVNGGAVSQLPDRRALFHLFVTNDGFVLDKKTL
jgi:hypothetical protein